MSNPYLPSVVGSFTFMQLQQVVDGKSTLHRIVIRGVVQTPF